MIIMNKKTILVCLSTVIIAGCATFPSPKADNSTLVVGSIVLNAKGYENYSGATVNGTHTRHIEVSIQNIDSGKIEKLVSDSSGFFYTDKLDAGKYRLKKFYFKSSVGGYNADILISITSGDRNFEVIKDQVNNLGEITWNADSEEGTHYWLNKDYENSKTMLANSDKKGKWAAIKVKNVIFKK
jgi:hypothetical protein